MKEVHMASPGLAAPSATTPPDPRIAIQYGILVQKAEAVPPAETVYNPGDVINVAYGLKRITRSTTRCLPRLIRIPGCRVWPSAEEPAEQRPDDPDGTEDVF